MATGNPYMTLFTSEVLRLNGFTDMKYSDLVEDSDLFRKMKVKLFFTQHSLKNDFDTPDQELKFFDDIDIIKECEQVIDSGDCIITIPKIQQLFLEWINSLKKSDAVRKWVIKLFHITPDELDTAMCNKILVEKIISIISDNTDNKPKRVNQELAILLGTELSLKETRKMLIMREMQI